MLSERVLQHAKRSAALLYLLDLSYRAASLALKAFWVSLCKNRMYDVVQVVAGHVPDFQQEQIFVGLQTPALKGF